MFCCFVNVRCDTILTVCTRCTSCTLFTLRTLGTLNTLSTLLSLWALSMNSCIFCTYKPISGSFINMRSNTVLSICTWSTLCSLRSLLSLWTLCALNTLCSLWTLWTSRTLWTRSQFNIFNLFIDIFFGCCSNILSCLCFLCIVQFLWNVENCIFCNRMLSI